MNKKIVIESFCERLFITALDNRHDHFEAFVCTIVCCYMCWEDHSLSSFEKVRCAIDDDLCFSIDDLREAFERRDLFAHAFTGIERHQSYRPRYFLNDRLLENRVCT